MGKKGTIRHWCTPKNEEKEKRMVGHTLFKGSQRKRDIKWGQEVKNSSCAKSGCWRSCVYKFQGGDSKCEREKTPA